MSTAYSAGNIQVLKGLEAVRKRPGMYIGSTGPSGLHHLVYEVVDNSIDEAMAGHCKEILVVLEKNDIVRVEDDGRGIPVDIHPTEGVSALELVLTRLHAGGKFDKGSYKVSGGLHGVGVSCVNALSDWLEATICRDGHIYQQKYERGVPKSKVEKVGDTDKHGTIIRWKADKTIFTETTTYNFDTLKDRLRELAFLNKGIVIVFRDERLENPKEEVLKFEGGINQFVQMIDEGKTIVPQEPIYINEERDDVITEIVNVTSIHLSDYDLPTSENSVPSVDVTFRFNVDPFSITVPLSIDMLDDPDAFKTDGLKTIDISYNYGGTLLVGSIYNVYVHNLANISDKLEYYYSTEIPVGNYEGPSPKEPIKSFAVNDFVVHGPEGYQRVTARANSKEELENLVDKLT